MIKQTILLSGVLLLVGVGCNAPVDDNTPTTTEQHTTTSTTVDAEQQTVYTSESWKDIIPSACQNFSDGCNTCVRSEGSEVAACTRKACMTYERPVCLEAVDSDGETVTDTQTERRVEVLKSNKQGDPNAQTSATGDPIPGIDITVEQQSSNTAKSNAVQPYIKLDDVKGEATAKHDDDSDGDGFEDVQSSAAVQ